MLGQITGQWISATIMVWRKCVNVSERAFINCLPSSLIVEVVPPQVRIGRRRRGLVGVGDLSESFGR